jgi:hypothetical protein
MLFRSDRTQRLDRIADMLRTGQPSADLISGAAAVCERVLSSRESQHIKALIDAGAWTDAALTLLAIELPSWKLRRMIYDEGEWHCAISRERELPEWLDDAIEVHHADLAITVLKAVVEGLRLADDKKTGKRSIRAPLNSENLISCDNFG